MKTMRAWIGLCCAAMSGACVEIPRSDAGREAAAEASVEASTDAATPDAEAGMDAAMDVVVEAAVEASVSMDAAVEAEVEPAPEPTVEAGAEGGDAADARTCAMGQTLCGASCVDTQSSASHCGTCGNACTGSRACISGMCQCPAGSTECGASCVMTSSDRLNCGACGTMCPALIGCMGGTCQCPMGTPTVCAGACTDTQSNALHCGMCGRACAMGQSCVGGACECPAGQTLCGGTCVDTRTNNSNCGACGTSCTMPERCVTSACRCPTAGETLCAGACVDTQTSTTNCGMCGRTCAAGQVCSMGTCACPAGQMLCGGACVNTAVSSSHCGACNNACTGGRTCQSSTCRCVFPQNDCGGSTCLDLTTDLNNCGGCGTVCTPPPNMIASCASGCTYTCRAGFGDCDGNSANGCETDLSSARDNCGMCGTFCDGTCSGGTCGEWARAMVERNGSSWPRAIASDGDGNIYIAGTFSVSITVVPGRTLAPMGASGGFLVSFTRAGTFRWLRQIESSATDYLQSIAVTGSGASTVVAVAGGTQTNIDFGGGALTAPTSSRGFVAVYNGDGVYRWAHMWSSDGGAQTSEMARGVAISPVDGDVAVTAGFYRTLTGSGWGASSSTAPGNIAIVRFSSTGVPRTPVTVLNVTSGSAIYPRAVAYNGGGDVCLTAMLNGQVNDGGGLLGAVASNADVMAGCYDAPTGARRWASVAVAAGTQDPAVLVIDPPTGNVTIGGVFAGTVNFGAGSLVANGTTDSFVTQFSVIGTNRWVQQLGTVNAAEGLTGLVLGSGGELFAFGHTQGLFNFGTSMLSSGFGQSTYIAAMTASSGAALRATLLAGNGTEYAHGMTLCSTGFLCVLGAYGGSTVSIRSATLPTVAVGYDSFFGRITQAL